MQAPSSSQRSRWRHDKSSYPPGLAGPSQAAAGTIATARQAISVAGGHQDGLRPARLGASGRSSRPPPPSRPNGDARSGSCPALGSTTIEGGVFRASRRCNPGAISVRRRDDGGSRPGAPGDGLAVEGGEGSCGGLSSRSRPRLARSRELVLGGRRRSTSPPASGRPQGRMSWQSARGMKRLVYGNGVSLRSIDEGSRNARRRRGHRARGRSGPRADRGREGLGRGGRVSEQLADEEQEKEQGGAAQGGKGRVD